MEQSPSWEASSHVTGLEIFRLFWNYSVYYDVHKSPPLYRILSQVNPVHTIITLYFNISYHLRLDLPSGLLYEGYSTKLFYAILICLVCVNVPHPSRRHLLFDHINHTWKDIVWSSSICGLFQHFAASVLLGPDILLSTLFSDIINQCSFLSVRAKFHAHT
jgi:hypothetical protein